jgi:hypothetical protein
MPIARASRKTGPGFGRTPATDRSSMGGEDRVGLVARALARWLCRGRHDRRACLRLFDTSWSGCLAGCRKKCERRVPVVSEAGAIAS